MPEVDVLKITNDDAAFVLGKNGKTKEKIARVSGAELDLFEHSLTLEIRGTDEERKRAKKCVVAPALPARPPSPSIKSTHARPATGWPAQPAAASQLLTAQPPRCALPCAGTSSASWRSASAQSPSTRTSRTTT